MTDQPTRDLRPSKPEAWQVALLDFRGAYGGEPDFENWTDVSLYLELLERAVRALIEREIVREFDEATTKLRTAAGAI